jgi:hypothetical protein
LTASQVLAKELVYDEDLNEDGIIGDVISSVVDSATFDFQYGLYKMTSGNYVIAEADLTEDQAPDQQILLTDSKDLPWTTTSQRIALDWWEPESGIEFSLVTASGTGSKGTYGYELFSLGQDEILAKSIQAMKTISYTDALMHELWLEQDLTGDDIIGPSVAIVADDSDAFGFEGLYKLAESGAFVISDAGLVEGDTFAYGDVLYADNKGKLWSSSAKDFALLYDDGQDVYKVITKTGTTYTEETFEWSDDYALVFKNKVTLKPAEVISREEDYDQDINGDGNIGESGFARSALKLVGIEDQMG